MNAPIPTRSERRRASHREDRSPSPDVAPCAPSAAASTLAPATGANAFEGDLGGVAAESGNRRESDLTPAHAGRAALRSMPVHPVHPLELYLLERRMGIGVGAAMLGLSERMLRDVLAWRRRLVFWREREIAVDLGIAVEELFPPPG